jgi:dTDP-4-amino-4,6-dideoxygalactose transaminase
MLADTPLQLPPHDATGRHAYYQYTVQAPRREDLQAFLETRAIKTQIMYPKLVPDQGAYQQISWRAADDMAVARSLVPTVLCLPMFAELTDEEVERVGAGIREFYAGD